MNDDELLNERLRQTPNYHPLSEEEQKRRASECVPECATPTMGQSSTSTTFDFAQWSAEPNESFRASGRRCESLPAGVYEIMGDDRGPFFRRKLVITDDLVELDDSAGLRVITGIRKFWQSRKRYVERGVIYKRGVLLWGPAGSGKTVTLNLLMKELVASGGVVVMSEYPKLLNLGLPQMRRIEPERPMIVVYEDIDETIRAHGEHEILSLLDGENQVSNVVNIATTNYPELLGERIVNRPSRFDERIHIGMPSAAARLKYLQHATRKEAVVENQLTRWVEETNGLSIAHLRELVIAVYCLGQEYDDVIGRLRSMKVQPKSGTEFGTSGFHS